MSKGEWRRSVETTGVAEILDMIENSLGDLWAAHPEIPEDVRLHVAVAASEIGTNIMEHSGSGVPIRVHMSVILGAQQIEVIFTDDGKPAEVDLDTVAFPDHTSHRGRGLAIASDLLDGLSYSRERGLNTWKLVHRRFA